MAEFCRIMREDSSVQNRDLMSDNVINLLEDAIDFSWSDDEASYSVLLWCREKLMVGKLTGQDVLMHKDMFSRLKIPNS